MEQPHALGLLGISHGGTQRMSEYFGCIVAPHFAAQALLFQRPGTSAPVVVMDGVKPWEKVYAMNAAAGALCVCRGMTRVEVETFGSVEFLTRSRAAEADASDVLMKCAERFTPCAQQRTSTCDWECVLDLAGSERLLGSPAKLARNFIDQTSELGLHLHVVMTANMDAGFSLARHFAGQRTGQYGDRSGRVLIVERGDEGRSLATLPIVALSLTEAQLDRFAAWGIRTLGELARLPEVELIARMGQEGRRLRQRARGELKNLLIAQPAELHLQQSVLFDDAIDTVEQVLFTVNPMLDHLFKLLREHALAVAAVTLTFELESCGDRTLEGHREGDTQEPLPEKFARTIRPAIPVLDRALLLKMIQLDLEAHPAPLPIVRIVLTAETGEQSRIQLGLFAPQMPEPARFEDTHARLVALVGEQNVGRIRPADTHKRDTFHVERFTLPTVDYKVARARAPQPPSTALRRMRPPVEVRVWMRQQAMECFQFESRRYRVVRTYGPWRTSGDWWTPQVWSSDTWDVAAENDDGELLVCVVAHDLVRDRWQMEALYD